jgi:hypothetical protein
VDVYPQRIAGKNFSTAYSEGSFILTYESDVSIDGPTEIFIPKKKNIKIFVNGECVTEPYTGLVFKYKNDLNKIQKILITWDNS